MTVVPTRTGTRRSVPRAMLATGPARESLLAKLDRMSHVEYDPDGTAHRVWHGTTSKDGYGRVRIPRAGYIMPVHRVAYELATGDQLPPELDVDHNCDRRACITVEHLDPVTRAQNYARSTAARAALAAANATRAGVAR